MFGRQDATPAEVNTRTGDIRPSRQRRSSGAQLPYLPGLDGLRAISVLAVLLYHYRGDRSLLRGGFLGVEVFFVISGYLITSLLLAETQARQRVDLRHFWNRRIRRLWPALIAMMLITGLIVAVFYHEDLGRLRGDLAFGFYGENWWHIVHGVSYVDIAADAGRRQPFQHLWSLAVEEQFYVVWPLVFTFGMWLGRPRLRVDDDRSRDPVVDRDGVVRAARQPEPRVPRYRDARVGPARRGAPRVRLPAEATNREGGPARGGDPRRRRAGRVAGSGRPVRHREPDEHVALRRAGSC